MKKRKSLFLCALIILPLLMSCKSTASKRAPLYQQIDEAVSQGRYDQGVETLEMEKEKIYRNLDIILYYLDKGMLAHFAEDYKDSIDLLQDGERAIEEAFTRSVTLEVSTYIVNDTTQEYPGEDYEDIYINAFNALSYYHLGNLESAMVEVRRMSNKLRFLSSKYGVVTSNMQKKALEDSAEIPPNEDIGSVQFTDSALARYLGMLFYRAQGDWDDARIDRDDIKIAIANAPRVYTFPAPQSIDEELEVPPDKARLNIIGFCGLPPIKQQKDIRIPLPGARWAKIALPVLVQRPSQVGRIEVLVNGEQFNLEPLENMGAVAGETFKEREKVIYLKSVLRGTIKGVAVAATNEAGKRVGGVAGVALQLGSLAGQVAAEASEQADLRMSRYIPAMAYVGGITVDPGIYDIQVTYYSQSGSVLARYAREDVLIESGALNLQEFICLK